MDMTQMPEYDNHARVVQIEDKKTGLKAVISLHRNGKFKHAFGATRIWNYGSMEEALKDSMKLSKIMSYKCALAGINYAGAKGVIITPENPKDRQAQLEVYLKEVNKLKGAFITGADVGISPQDVKWMRERSPYVVGVHVDPVRHTVEGIYYAMQVALDEVFGSKEVSKRSFAIQGLGKIGSGLLNILYKNGATIYATDVNEETVKKIQSKYPNIKIVAPDEIHSLEVDVFSPCALSNCINHKTVHEIKSPIVLGGANSQLESDEMGEILHERGILYGPDYVVNAGGIISVVCEFENENFYHEIIEDRVKNIANTLWDIIQKSKTEKIAINKVANEKAIEIID
jgi:leucine dehydrogenase